MKLKNNKDGTYSLINLSKEQLKDIVGDMSVAEFESVETQTYYEIKKLVERELGKVRK